jgi:hypothetical protein
MESMQGGEIMPSRSKFIFYPEEKRRCRPSDARNVDIFQVRVPTKEHHKKARQKVLKDTYSERARRGVGRTDGITEPNHKSVS